MRGAAVSLVRDERLARHGVPEDIAALERVQEHHQAGPCVEAFRTGSPVLVTDLATEPERWPELTTVAAARGIVSLASIPMHLHGDHLGALDLYDTRPHPWSEEEVEVRGPAGRPRDRLPGQRLPPGPRPADGGPAAGGTRQPRGHRAGGASSPVSTGSGSTAPSTCCGPIPAATRMPLREVARMVVDGSSDPDRGQPGGSARWVGRSV